MVELDTNTNWVNVINSQGVARNGLQDQLACPMVRFNVLTESERVRSGIEAKV